MSESAMVFFIPVTQISCSLHRCFHRQLIALNDGWGGHPLDRHSRMTAITSEVQVHHLPKSRQPPRDTKLQGWCLAGTGVGTDWMSCLMEWKQETRSIQSLCRSFHPSNVEVSLQAFRKGVIICVCLKSWYTTNEYYSIEWGETHYLQAGLGIF